MKRSTVFIALLFAISSASYAQMSVQDQHPTASISVVDYQSGNLVPAMGDQAILFKDALINLVVSTNLGKQLLERAAPGDKRMVISQMNPQPEGNAYKVDYTLYEADRATVLFTFMYNSDRNTLFYYRTDLNRWEPVSIMGTDLYNLNNVKTYSRFNTAGADQPVSDAYSAPVDVDVMASAPPPPLPAYEQPECTTEGYLWQPGYWAYRPNGDGYYWVPGVWVAPPNDGLLWTPPYWGFDNGHFIFHSGYWGEHVGFYGGIDYGHGYQGSGFVGGEWHDNRFRYNTAVVRVNVVNVHNTYINKTVINNVTINNYTSYNGGNGVKAKPTQDEIKVEHQQHVPPTKQQIVNQVTARQNPTQFAKSNNGKPTETALAKPPVIPIAKAQPNGNKGGKTPATQEGPNGAKPGLKGGQPATPVKTGGNAVPSAGNMATPVVGENKPIAPANPVVKPAQPTSTGFTPANAVKPVVPSNTGIKAVAPAINATPVKPVLPGNNSGKPAQPPGNGVHPANPNHMHGSGDTSRKTRTQVKKPMPPRPPVKPDTSKKKS